MNGKHNNKDREDKNFFVFYDGSVTYQMLLFQYYNLGAFFDQIIGSCTSNSVNGEELKKEGDILIELVKKCIQGPEMLEQHRVEMQNQYVKVADLLWIGQIQMLKELEENVKAHEPNLFGRKPEDFLSIMGGVMNKYRARVAWRLGFFGSMKLKKATDAADNDDEE